jgi:hypothetical protein
MGPMERASGSTAGAGYLARLRGGPDDGALVRVASLPGGAPPDFLRAGLDDSGMYVLAGMPHPDGAMPYWFMPSLPQPEDAVAFEQSTWTLVSMAGAGHALKIWHQHGEGTRPIRLRPEAVESGGRSGSASRAYVCPECEDTTVVSDEGGWFPGPPGQRRSIRH